MNAVLLTIASLLTLLVTLLAIPLSMNLSIINDQGMQAHAQFRWLFGLVKFQATFPGETQTPAHKKMPLTKKHKPSRSSNNVHGFATLFKQSAYRRHIINFIKTLFRASHAKDLFLRLRIGLGDPADTGRLWAVVGPLSAMLKNSHDTKIEIEAEFIDSVIEIESHGNFTLIPLQFIALVIAFILSPMSIRAWRTMQRDNL